MRGQDRDAVVLRIDSIGLRFGGVRALSEVSIDVRAGELLSVVGPNGAGKTCIVNCINGFYRPNEGRIFFEGTEITRMPSYQIARLGVARTFQNLGLYTSLSVLDNIMAGAQHRMHYNTLQACLYFGKARRVEAECRRSVEEIIDSLELQHIRKELVATLPYGLRKRVELGKALAMGPKLLLLDEPMAGMNLEEKEEMVRFVLDTNGERGVTTVLIEHDMGVVMDISDRVVVLESGRKIADGRPAEVQGDSAVIKAYLGVIGPATDAMGVTV